ncbi:MAG TPA: YhgE/Pip domain-containing protein [Corynebacterium nuruki]|uniref:YhgE/Pip domain-containing protein n=1 Tax=Corynebacterium nuruki TaxID=1032851 RepID=A0A3D4SY17_9CORY|nr:YhgE/Pip domain-containing protein [Corynebacterium nuruki]
MRNILHIVRGDLRRIRRNVMTAVVVFGLIIIPLLFSCFNVLASWDPFGRTDQLRIAVASADEGHESDLANLRINLGDQVLSQLSRNDQIDWVVTDEDTAVEGTKSGEYYASIVLPPDFSTSMLTFYLTGTEPTHLALYTNEKKNALSTVITSQGADGVITQINDTFTRIISDVGLGVISSLSDYLDKDDTKAALDRIRDRVAGLGDRLHSVAGTTRSLTALLDSTKPLLTGADDIARAAGADFGNPGTDLGGGSGATADLGSTLKDATGSLETALTATGDSYAAVGDRLGELFDRAGSAGSGTAATFTTLADRVQQQTDALAALRDRVAGATPGGVPALDAAVDRSADLHDRLARTADDITAGTTSAAQSRQRTADALNRARQAVDGAVASYRQDLKPQLSQLGGTLDSLGRSVSGIRDDLDGITAGLSGSPGSVQGALDRARTTTATLADRLDGHAARFADLEKALATAGETGDFSRLAAIVGDDPDALASQLSAPVSVERDPVFPVASFGAGMAPLYTVLALWVGALLTVVLVRTSPPRDREYTRTQAYLGRFGLFALIGLAQSTLAVAGLVVFVQIGAVHPFLLLVSGWVTSVVFMLIVYTLVLSFGSAGKALSVVLLVIQVSGAGGAYPLPLLPGWFQAVSPWLPATYAMDAMRAAIAGMYRGDLWINLGMLLLFAVPALILGLFLRRFLDGYNRSTNAAIEKTKVMS